MAGVQKKIEEAVKALDDKQIRKALYLTSKRDLEKHHSWVEEAARTCLANKGNTQACDQAVKQARDKLQATITLPMDSVDMEGLEEFLTPQTQAGKEEPMAEQPTAETAGKTDEELYQHCDVCHVADAVVKFVNICQEQCAQPGDEGASCQVMTPMLEDEKTAPEQWISAMRQVASQEGCRQPAYKEILGELEDYLNQENSEILKRADELCKNAGAETKSNT